MIRFVAAFCLVVAPAFADDIRLSEPGQGASLHQGGVDMAVYWTGVDGSAEVVATYFAQGSQTAPARLRMALAQDEATTFALPGQRHVIYTFSRDAQAVTVSADFAPRDYAAAE